MGPQILSVLETPVYVDDMEQAHDFYHGVLGLTRMMEGVRVSAYDVAPTQALLVCLRGACDEDVMVRGALVPGHRADGPGHFAFRIAIDTIDAWIEHLEGHKIALESRVEWPGGGTSLYFRDPFDNVVELGTAGIWPNDPL